MWIFSKMTLLFPVVVIFVVTGCSGQPEPLYNYEGYSSSYYAFKKNAGEKSALELQKAIEESISNTEDSRSGRVPPGMYANLGYLYLKSGKSNEAISSFTQEKTIYPESAHFMDRMIKKVQVAEGKKNGE